MKKDRSIKMVAFVMIATIVARMLGFAREMFIAYKYGTTIFSDSIVSALSLPDLVINGFGASISALYIPLYLKALSDGKSEEKSFNSSISVILLTISVVFTTIIAAFPEFFVGLMASGFDQQTTKLSAELLRISILALLPILLSQQFKSFCQIRNQYALALLLGCIINICVIIGLFMSNENHLSIVSWSFVLGNVIYSIIVFILSFKIDFRYAKVPDFKSKYIKLLLVGIFPVFLANIITEINQIIDKNFASNIIVGGVSALNYSTKIINLVMSIVGLGIGAVYYPKLSEIPSKQHVKKYSLICEMNNFVLLICVPLLIYVSCYSDEIVSVLFNRGNFDSNSLKLTSACLQMYSICILTFNLHAIWVSVFHSELEMKLPSFISVFSMIVNVVLNFVFSSWLGLKGLALATGTSTGLAVLIMLWAYKVRHFDFDFSIIFKDAMKIAISSFSFTPLIVFYFFKKNGYFIDFLISGTIFIACSPLYYLLLRLTKNSFVTKRNSDSNTEGKNTGINIIVQGTEKKYIEFLWSDIINKDNVHYFKFEYSKNPLYRLINSKKININFDMPGKFLFRKRNFPFVNSLKTNQKNIVFFSDLLPSYFDKKYLLSLKENFDVEFVFLFMNDLHFMLGNDDKKIKKFVSSLPSKNVYSFDPKDCELFSMKYFSGIYPELLNDESEILYDFVFVGNGKDRREKVESLFLKLVNDGFKCKFIINSVNEDNKIPGIIYNCNMNYDQIIDLCKQSRCIVDIVVGTQSGLSTRFFEALSLNKKLLTNNPYVKFDPFFDSKQMYLIDDAMKIDYSFLREENNHKYTNEYSSYMFVNQFLPKEEKLK